MNIKIIRTSSIYGPFDNFDTNFSCCTSVNQKGTIKKILGSPWRPSVTRDFVYAEDLAKACILLSNHKFKGIVNFSSGNAITIRQLAKKIIKVLKIKRRLNLLVSQNHLRNIEYW